jgi:hypothetical protein
MHAKRSRGPKMNRSYGFMLWQKNWWETRIMLWTCLGAASLVTIWLIVHPSPDPSWAERLQRISGNWNEETRQALPSLSSFQGHLWAVWFKGVLKFLLPYFAMCWATFVPGCASPWTGLVLDGGRVFMLSLPVSRRGILLTQAAMGCGGLWLVAVGSSLLLPIISHWRGQWYSVKDALVFASLSFLGALVFYFLALLMTTIFDNGFKSLGCCVVVYLATLYPVRFIESSPHWNINRLIAGEDSFFHGRIPWLALIVSLLVSASLLFITVRVFERRDF